MEELIKLMVALQPDGTGHFVTLSWVPATLVCGPQDFLNVEVSNGQVWKAVKVHVSHYGRTVPEAEHNLERAMTTLRKSIE